jgi:orotidine-5'-phosphate decarboxylase
MADETRDRLAVALDVDDLVAALRLAQRVRPWFGVAKVGLELFAAAGPEAILALSGDGYRVFLDLKLHDIPTTVARPWCGPRWKEWLRGRRRRDWARPVCSGSPS